MNRALSWLLQRTPGLIATGIITLLIATRPAFQHSFLWLHLGQQYFAVAALALVMTPIILTGGIDLSVGSVSVFASVVIGVLWRDWGYPIEAALLGGVLAALLAGMLNGVLVVVGVMPLVATLATRELFRGVALTLSGEHPVSQFPPALAHFWRGSLAGLPIPLWCILLLFILTYLLTHHTWIGRMIYAIGDNRRAAWFAGIPVRRVEFGLYACSGLVAGLCGAALVMHYNSAKATAEPDLELLAIACVVMGGVRITGGFGHVAGSLLGIVTVCMLLSGLAGIHALGQNWRDTVLGGLLIGVALCNEAGNRWVARRRLPDAAPVNETKEPLPMAPTS